MNVRRRLTAVSAILATFVFAACGGGSDPLAESSAPASGGSGAPVVVGSADFTESAVLAELYAQAIAADGVPASTRLRIGSRELYLRALQDGSISMVPEYTGNLLLNYDADATATTAEEVLQALPEALPDEFAIGTPSTAVDQDVYVVTQEYSQSNGVTSLDDLKKVASTATLGGPPELETRAYGPQGLKEIYAADIQQFQPYTSSAVRARDLNDDKIQIGEFFSTESVILDNNFVVLEDPQAMILPQNVIPLYRAEVAENATITAAVEAVQQALTTEELTALNKQVDVDKMDPDQVAGDWLTSKGLA